MTVDDLPTPALVVDLDVLDANIETMAQRVSGLSVALRPHFKTHKCVEIAQRQRDNGAAGLTVSTLFEARVAADHGFDDVTWAFPAIVNRLPEAADLARRITLRVVVDSREAVDALIALGQPLPVRLKVDCGYHRAGLDPESDEVVELARTIHDSATLVFDGILSHSGHAYGADDPGRIAEEERRVMATLAQRLRDRGLPVPSVSVGSTPSMAAVATLDGVTEARPGNYTLYDFSQVSYGSCTARDCAATVVASVVSSPRHLDHCIIDAGALALSKDPGPDGATMGEIYTDYAAGTLHPDHRVISLSQEHGKVNTPLPVGSRVRVLPNHSCLTVAQFDHLHAVRGTAVVDRWRVWRGRD